MDLSWGFLRYGFRIVTLPDRLEEFNPLIKRGYVKTQFAVLRIIPNIGGSLPDKGCGSCNL